MLTLSVTLNYDFNCVGLPRPVDITSSNQKSTKETLPRTVAFIEELKQVSAQKPQERKRLPTTGHAFIDFELNGKDLLDCLISF